MRTPRSLALAILAADCFAAGCSFDKELLPWQNPSLSVEKRADDKLRRMTAAEKLSLLAGDPIRKFDVPADFPPEIAMAATWDTRLVGEEARAIASQALELGRDQVLGPDLQGYGDNAWLASRMAVAFVGGVQSESEIATLKTFPTALPYDRNVNETEYPPFRAAIEEAGAWSVIADTPSSAAVRDVLEKNWGFKGFVIGASKNDLDEKVRRVLRAMFATGFYDRKRKNAASADQSERVKVTHQAGLESAILLKNAGPLLPLDASKIHSIAVIGSNPPHGIRERAGTMIEVSFAPGDNLPAAAALARKSDVAILCIAADTNDQLIGAVAKANPRTIALLTSGPVKTPVKTMDKWIDQIPAVLNTWMDNGVPELLFGDVSPSGKLPVSDTMFPFGFGLSYTAFTYSELRIFPATPRYGQIVQVAVNVRNTGKRTGSEIVQLYIHQVKPSLDRPVELLRGLGRVELKPGESATVPFELDRRSIWFFDPAVRDWATEPGVYDVWIGSSSGDIRLKGSFELFQ